MRRFTVPPLSIGRLKKKGKYDRALEQSWKRGLFLPGKTLYVQIHAIPVARPAGGHEWDGADPSRGREAAVGARAPPAAHEQGCPGGSPDRRGMGRRAAGRGSERPPDLRIPTSEGTRPRATRTPA